MPVCVFAFLAASSNVGSRKPPLHPSSVRKSSTQPASNVSSHPSPSPATPQHGERAQTSAVPTPRGLNRPITPASHQRKSHTVNSSHTSSDTPSSLLDKPHPHTPYSLPQIYKQPGSSRTHQVESPHRTLNKSSPRRGETARGSHVGTPRTLVPTDKNSPQSSPRDGAGKCMLVDVK